MVIGVLDSSILWFIVFSLHVNKGGQYIIDCIACTAMHHFAPSHCHCSSNVIMGNCMVKHKWCLQKLCTSNTLISDRPPQTYPPPFLFYFILIIFLFLFSFVCFMGMLIFLCLHSFPFFTYFSPNELYCMCSMCVKSFPRLTKKC